MIKIFKNKIYRPELIAQVLNQDATFSNIEIIHEPEAVAEILPLQFDVIEVNDSMLKDLKPQLTYLDWALNTSGVFDCLIKHGSEYSPEQINAEAFRGYLEKSHKPLGIDNCAVLIGDYSFIASFSLMLARLGYSHIYVVSYENILFDDQIEILKKSLFGVKLVQLSFDELATIKDFASILIIDFELKDNAELVEILTYFNFLTEGATFCDLNSYRDDSLAQEAEKVLLRVVDINEFIKIKYDIIKKKLNNRS